MPRSLLRGCFTPKLGTGIHRHLKRSFSSPAESRTIQSLDWIWVGLITLLPLVPLAFGNNGFGYDWSSHQWLTAYFAEYVWEHGRSPEVLHVDQLVGIPYPVFYGTLLYPLLGMAGAVCGASWALRLGIGTALLLQNWQVFRWSFQVTGNRAASRSLAAVAGWAIYPLTNLYSRGALNEYVAVALLTASLAVFGRAFISPAASGRVALVWQGFLWLTLAAGAHPISALCGGAFIAFFLVLSMGLSPAGGTMLRSMGLAAGLCLVVLGPWIYAVVSFASQLEISKTDSKAISYLEVDTPASRLMPIPFDGRLRAHAELPLSATPHLDTQLNFGLLIGALLVTVWFFFGRSREKTARRTAVAVGLSWLLFGVMFGISTYPPAGALLPGIFRNVQFVYRLVSYLNLALLVILLLGAQALNGVMVEPRLRPRLKVGLGVLVSVAVLGLGLKFRTLGDTAVKIEQLPAARVVEMPRAFYGWFAFAVVGSGAASGGVDMSVAPTVGTGSAFGHVEGGSFTLSERKRVKLGVQPFPWNEVRLDNQPVALFAPVATPGGMIVSLGPGVHRLDYQWRPDPVWQILHACSWLALAGWIFGLLFEFGRTRWLPAAS